MKIAIRDIDKLSNVSGLMVDGNFVKDFIFDEETTKEIKIGNLNAINALYNFLVSEIIQEEHKISDELKEELGVSGEVYSISNLPTMSMYHKYSRITIMFRVKVSESSVYFMRIY